MQAFGHLSCGGLGTARHGRLRLRHEQEQVFPAIDAQGVHGGEIVDASQRKIEQRPEVLIAARRRLRRLEHGVHVHRVERELDLAGLD